MGTRAAFVRLRVDARRPAAWLGAAIVAAAVWWCSGAAWSWWPVVAIVAAAGGTVAALGQLPGAGGAAAWACGRAAWAAAGAGLGWLATGAVAPAHGPAVTALVACGATAAAVAGAAHVGRTPADSASLGLALAVAAAAGAGVAIGWAAAWPAAAVGAWLGAALVMPPLSRSLRVVAGRTGGPLDTAVPRAVMGSALGGMVIFLFLAPHLAWAFVAVAVAWLLAGALPHASLGPGVEDDAARRRLLATTGRHAGAGRAAVRLVASYAAVLVWPPLVAAVLAGTVASAAAPLTIAAVIAAAAATIAPAAAAPLAAGAARDTAQAVALGAALAAFVAGVSALGWVAAPVNPPPGLMLSNPGDPATLPGPRAEPRLRPSPRGVVSCPASPSLASASRPPFWPS